MNRIKWEDAMECWDSLEEIYELDRTASGPVLRQYLEQPHWTFTAGVVLGVSLGILASVIWRLLA